MEQVLLLAAAVEAVEQVKPEAGVLRAAGGPGLPASVCARLAAGQFHTKSAFPVYR